MRWLHVRTSSGDSPIHRIQTLSRIRLTRLGMVSRTVTILGSLSLLWERSRTEMLGHFCKCCMSSTVCSLLCAICRVCRTFRQAVGQEQCNDSTGKRHCFTEGFLEQAENCIVTIMVFVELWAAFFKICCSAICAFWLGLQSCCFHPRRNSWLFSGWWLVWIRFKLVSDTQARACVSYYSQRTQMIMQRHSFFNFCWRWE